AYFFFSSRRRHTRSYGDWSSDVCSSDLVLCRTALRLPPPTRLRRTNTCLLGVCSTLFGLQLAHCAVAVDTLMLAVWCLAGLAGEIGRASCREGVGVCGAVGAAERGTMVC